jgi:hypothetical protein
VTLYWRPVSLRGTGFHRADLRFVVNQSGDRLGEEVEMAFKSEAFGRG